MAGYQYGGMYEAHITITTSTSDQLDKVKMQLGAKLRTMNASNDKVVTSADMQFSRETQEILKKYNAEISVEIKTIGAGATTPTNIPMANSQDLTAMNNVVGELTKFRNDLAASFSPATYAPVNVMLMRYRSIKAAATKLPRTIPVPFTHAALINEFNRELINMRGYYNVGIVNAGGDDFYFDEGFVNTCLPEVRSISSQLKDVSDRYSFYCMLIAAQNAEAGQNERICWISVTAPHENDNARTLLTKPAMGKQKVSFSFESALSMMKSNGDWKIDYQTIDMPSNLYPFTGLKD